MRTLSDGQNFGTVAVRSRPFWRAGALSVGWALQLIGCVIAKIRGCAANCSKGQCTKGRVLNAAVFLRTLVVTKTQRTLPSFLGVINVGEAHSLAPCGDKTPIFTKCNSFFLRLPDG